MRILVLPRPIEGVPLAPFTGLARLFRVPIEEPLGQLHDEVVVW